MDFTSSLYRQRAVSVKFEFIAPRISIRQFLRASKEHRLDEPGFDGHQTSLGICHVGGQAARPMLLIALPRNNARENRCPRRPIFSTTFRRLIARASLRESTPLPSGKSSSAPARGGTTDGWGRCIHPSAI